MSRERPKEDTQLRRALEKTVPAVDFTPAAVAREREQTESDSALMPTPQQLLQRTREASDGTMATDTSSLELSHFGVSDSVPEQLRWEEGSTGPRFSVEQQIGSGGTGRVYAVRDHSLNRTIAVKFLKRRTGKSTGVRQHFLHEARVTAMLEHPNIMPVHDIGVTQSGEVYFTMKSIHGSSLGDAIRAASEGKAPGALGSIDERIRVFLKVCDALTFAHHRGFIHQDVKPDNIMLGEFGEVLLLDWGSALERLEIDTVSGKALYGTPAYMSPEQARRESVSERSDIYSLGATLFHALLLRHPTWAEDAEGFWEKKRSGIVDEPSDAERRTVPAALLAITLKALKADPDERYATVDEFASDLKAYQAGLAVSAHRESLLERFGRWYRRNRRFFWTVSAATAVVAAVAGLFFREKILEVMTWRALYAEDFEQTTTEQLARRWHAYVSYNWLGISRDTSRALGGWEVRDGALVGRGESSLYDLTFTSPVPGDIRVEWDVTCLRLTNYFNCYVAGATRAAGYTFHTGMGGPRMITLTKGPELLQLDRAQRQTALEVNQTYRFRMEREGKHIRLNIDGEQVLDYVDNDVLAGVDHQTFGFETCNGNTVRIDNIEVYYHPLPLKVSPLATPDRFLEEGLYGRARALYEGLWLAYPERDVGAEALFKMGRCLRLLDSAEAALSTLETFEQRYPNHERIAESNYERARVLIAMGKVAEGEDVYRGMARAHPGHPLLRNILHEMSDTLMAELTVRYRTVGNGMDSARDAATIAWIDERERAVRAWAVELGLAHERVEFLERAMAALQDYMTIDSLEVRFPYQRAMLASRVVSFGQYDRVFAEYADQASARLAALRATAQYTRILHDFPHLRNECAASLRELGRFEDVLRYYPDQRSECARALLRLGRYEELLAAYADQVSLCDSALLRLGRPGEVLDRTPPLHSHALLAAATLGLPPSAAIERLQDNQGAVASAYELSGHFDRAVSMMWNAADSYVIGGRRSVRMALLVLHNARPDRMLELSDDKYWRRIGLAELGRGEEVLAWRPANREQYADALREMAMYDSILSYIPDHRIRCVEALRLAGRNEEILRRYPENVNACATALVMLGRAREAIERFPEIRTLRVSALQAEGKYEEILDGLPDIAAGCADALAALGRIEELVKRYPEYRSVHARALLARGRFEDVVTGYPDQALPYAFALIHLGRGTQIPRSGDTWVLTPPGDMAATYYRALWEWRTGRRRVADSLFALPLRHGYAESGWYPLRFSRFLLPSLLHELAGSRGALAAACRRVSARYPAAFRRQLWHEAQYLCGAIGDKEFLSQPHGERVAERLALMRAVRADVSGRADSALAAYRQAVDIVRVPAPDPVSSLVDDPVVAAFVAWRMDVLAGP